MTEGRLKTNRRQTEELETDGMETDWRETGDEVEWRHADCWRHI